MVAVVAMWLVHYVTACHARGTMVPASFGTLKVGAVGDWLCVWRPHCGLCFYVDYVPY
jgi:hypothetical protein